MPLGLLGLKVGMTQVYDANNKIAPVTVLHVGPCPVLQVRNQERDGYDAVQLGFLDKKRTKATRAERGHVSDALESKRLPARVLAGRRRAKRPRRQAVEPQKHVREFRLEKPADVAVGTVLKAADVFKDGQAVDVIGTSKGRGTAGVMKQHNFAGLPASHGAQEAPPAAWQRRLRTPATAASGRPKRGKLHGRAGGAPGAASPVRNLRVVKIDAENNVVLVEVVRAGAG